jgi:hypothetical protein
MKWCKLLSQDIVQYLLNRLVTYRRGSRQTTLTGNQKYKPNMAAERPLEQNTLEIRTKSIEQTLIPLVKQVSKYISVIY